LTESGAELTNLFEFSEYIIEKPDEWEKNRSCKIPRVYPFEEAALRMIEDRVRRKGEMPPCVSKPSSRFETDLNTTLIRLDPGSGFWTGVSCCYTPFTSERPDFELKFMYVFMVNLV